MKMYNIMNEEGFTKFARIPLSNFPKSPTLTPLTSFVSLVSRNISYRSYELRSSQLKKRNGIKLY